MKKLILGCALTSVFFTVPALANPTQIAIAKKAVETGEVTPYATAEFKQLLSKAHKVNSKMSTPDNELGCEFYEGTYLGHFHDSPVIKNWKATATNNIVRVTFVHGSYDGGADYGASLIEFTMKGNQIHDVRHGYSDNSLRIETQKIVNTNNCVF